jgi:hypothetical protein
MFQPAWLKQVTKTPWCLQVQCPWGLKRLQTNHQTAFFGVFFRCFWQVVGMFVDFVATKIIAKVKQHQASKAAAQAKQGFN